MRLALVFLLFLLPTPAFAQLQGLPGGLSGGLPTGVPSVGNLPVVRGLTDVADRVEDTVTQAAGQRLSRIDDLIRRHGDVLERSPDGDLIVRHQLVALSPAPAAMTAITAAGFTIGETTALDSLGLQQVVLIAPHGMATKKALRLLRKLDPDGVYDFNDIYLGSQSGGSGAGESSVHGAGGGRVGLIDGGVDTAHPAFRGAHIVQQGFAGKAVASEHGTATASLLVGRSDGFTGAAPGAELIVADIYGNMPTGGSTSALLKALDWMAGQKVGVINISLVGPPNVPLRTAVATLVGRGYLIVAAVGNDGPAAKPLYPASFDGVVGVTAVDRRNKVLLEAGRGPQVDLAAPGSDIAAAAPGGKYVAVRGTSFAAPIVAGLLARRLSAPDPQAARAALTWLSSQAIDLGAKGTDTTYGAGLVGNDIRPVVPASGKKN